MSLTFEVIVTLISDRRYFSDKLGFNYEIAQVKELIVEESMNQLVPIGYTILNLIFRCGRSSICIPVNQMYDCGLLKI